MKLNPTRQEARKEIAITLQYLQIPERNAIALSPPQNWEDTIGTDVCFGISGIGKFTVFLARQWSYWIVKIAPGLSEDDTLKLHSLTGNDVRAFGLGRNSPSANYIHMTFKSLYSDKCSEWHIDSVKGLQLFLEFLLNHGK